jgi:murein DD-endopeptidase MepM/ murein hydrolase activator NlpD
LGSFGAAGALVFGACGPTQCTPTAPASAPVAPTDPSAITLDAKPVQGPCTYIDTFGQARGGDRVHLGTDIGAAEGNEVYAVSAGEVIKVYTDAPGSLAGNGLRFRRADGTVIFYAHLLAVVPGIAVGTALDAGQVVGQVGQTGNAGGPHLHVEIHRAAGEAVNPYPIIRAIGAC